MKENEVFLAQWISNSLSKDELEEFIGTKDYEIYKSILDGIDKLKVKDYPSDVAYKEFKEKLNETSTEKEINKEEQSLFNQSENDKRIEDGLSKLSIEDYSFDEAYSDFKYKLERKSKNKSKLISLASLRSVAIAACAIALLGIGFFASNTTHVTQIAGTQRISLPDNSVAILNADSKISYNKILFFFNRKLSLSGEAFFEVEKGSAFTVQTNNGDVEVLGTKFNVISMGNYFETACFEGRVQVSTPRNEVNVLRKGNKVQYNNEVESKIDFHVESESPSWIEGISTFKSSPLSHVIKNLEMQFGFSFDTTNLKNTSSLYTGEFQHDDFNAALESVFLPMGIEYTKGKKTNTVLLKSKNQ